MLTSRTAQCGCCRTGEPITNGVSVETRKSDGQGSSRKAVPRISRRNLTKESQRHWRKALLTNSPSPWFKSESHSRELANSQKPRNQPTDALFTRVWQTKNPRHPAMVAGAILLPVPDVTRPMPYRTAAVADPSNAGRSRSGRTLFRSGRDDGRIAAWVQPFDARQVWRGGL
jgi:hypothetical protein